MHGGIFSYHIAMTATFSCTRPETAAPKDPPKWCYSSEKRQAWDDSLALELFHIGIATLDFEKVFDTVSHEIN